MVYWAASFSKADKGGQKVAKHYPILANKNDIMYSKALSCTASSFTVRNDLQDILEFVFSTIKIVAGYNYYGQKNYVYQATNSLYHLAHFCCRTLQQNWVYSFKLSKNSKAG